MTSLIENHRLTDFTDKASCHCGAFAYNVTASPPLDDAKAEVIRKYCAIESHVGDSVTNDVAECNCSICTRNGYLFTYTTNSNVEFTKGEFDGLQVRNALSVM
jgi:hypothetical protein